MILLWKVLSRKRALCRTNAMVYDLHTYYPGCDALKQRMVARLLPKQRLPIDNSISYSADCGVPRCLQRPSGGQTRCCSRAAWLPGEAAAMGWPLSQTLGCLPTPCSVVHTKINWMHKYSILLHPKGFDFLGKNDCPKRGSQLSNTMQSTGQKIESGKRACTWHCF